MASDAGCNKKVKGNHEVHSEPVKNKSRLISVARQNNIDPIFNVSLTARSYQHLELLITNNGSYKQTDRRCTGCRSRLRLGRSRMNASYFLSLFSQAIMAFNVEETIPDDSKLIGQREEFASVS